MKYYLFIILGILSFGNSAQAQFDDFPVSVALDNVLFQFGAQGWEPQSSSFTQGNSAMRSFHVEGNSLPSIDGFVSGDKTITFDYRFQANTAEFISDEFTFTAFTEFGRTPVKETITTETTNGWQTASFYIPKDVFQIKWSTTSGFGSIAWLDNVHIVDGNQIPDGSEPPPGGDGPPFQFAANTLSQAVDNTRFQMLNGDPGFFHQTRTSNVDGDAAQSANIGNNQQALMGVVVMGPTTASFDWKVSSEEGFDFLVAAVFNDRLQQTNIGSDISGEKDWKRQELNIPSGEHLIVWAYLKDSSVSSGMDTGWIDHVKIGGLSDIEDKPRGLIAPIILLLLNE